MDKNMLWNMEQRVKITMENLEKNNMEAYFVKDEEEMMDKVKEIVTEGETVAVGGSMTLFETGIIDYLRNGKFNFLIGTKKILLQMKLKKYLGKVFLQIHIS
ncbi:LUD domain-containing protein [Clostridium sp. DMHC 10]|uniref:LUD domain-containing protein n=1 Tax=Clostridium sp. DMHC 10 TaxID=747377 RepID=UPI000A4D4F51|nr:LUD domain-containing protein [Clostridium sp. DMHC 10]